MGRLLKEQWFLAGAWGQHHCSLWSPNFRCSSELNPQTEKGHTEQVYTSSGMKMISRPTGRISKKKLVTYCTRKI